MTVSIGTRVDASYGANDLHHLPRGGPNAFLVLERVEHHDVLPDLYLLAD